MKRLIPVCTLIILLSMSIAGAGTWIPLNYPGAISTSATGISDGNIVGYYYDGSNYHGFLYNGTSCSDLNIPVGIWIAGKLSISGNNVVGSYLKVVVINNFPGFVTASFLYNGTSWAPLDYPGANYTLATGISDSNIVGYYYDGSNYHGFLYNGTSWAPLDYPGGTNTHLEGISDGNIVGYYYDGSNYHGFLYNGTSWAPLDYPGGTDTHLEGISGNNIVGYYYDGSNYHGFLYNGTSWAPLDYPGAISTEPIGISGSDMVGRYTDSSGYGHGFIYTETAALLLLKPNGNEKLSQGSQYEIKWSRNISGSEVLIEYSVDNGISWNTIASVQDVNSYNWQVQGPASRDCLVRVTATDFLLAPISATSDNTFLIYSCNENLAGDLNHDCQVDMIDFAIMAQNWLKESRYIFYSFPLDYAPNWTTEGGWQFGQPCGSGGFYGYGYPDPYYNGYTGTNVYGVNLYGDYTVAIGGPYYLTAGPFDCNGFGNVKLKFARWLNTDENSYVKSKVEASNDGNTWFTVWENTTEVMDSTWQVVEYDISGIADNQPTVYFRWGYEILSNRAFPYSGWNIDDIELSGTR